MVMNGLSVMKLATQSLSLIKTTAETILIIAENRIEGSLFHSGLVVFPVVINVVVD